MFDEMPSVRDPQALDTVFEMARLWMGSFHPDERNEWIEWLEAVQLARHQRAGYAAKAKAERAAVVEKAKAEREAARQSRLDVKAAAQTKKYADQAERYVERRKARELERDIVRRRQLLREMEPGPRCQLCREPGHSKSQCRFDPMNNGEPIHEPYPHKPLWQLTLEMRGSLKTV
jgi:hypothetical protein